MADEEPAQARGDEMVPGSHLRARDDDRDRVVELLRVAAGDGRLTLEQLDERVRAGSLRLVTRPGILVSTDDLAVRSSSVKVRAPWGPGVPVRFRIEVAGTVASSSFKARPPRRTLWRRLRRRPLPPALPPGRT